MKYSIILILASALQGQPANPHLAAAARAEQSGNLAAAELEYEKALALRFDAGASERLGLVRHLQNKFSEAIPAFTEALKLQPDRWASRLFLGIDLYRTNRFERALAELKLASKLRPDEFEIRFWMGAAELALKNYFAGFEILEALLREQPENLEILRLLGESYAALGTELLNNVAEKYPNTPAGIEVHAQALEFEGANGAALEMYRELRRIAPDRPGVSQAIERLRAISSGLPPP